MISRRGFFGRLATVLGVGAVVPAVVKAEERKGGVIPNTIGKEVKPTHGNDYIVPRETVIQDGYVHVCDVESTGPIVTVTYNNVGDPPDKWHVWEGPMTADDFPDLYNAITLFVGRKP